MRSLLLIAILLIAAACGGAASRAPDQTVNPGTQATPAATGQVVPITVKDFTLDPLTVTVQRNSFSLAVTNAGPTVHNVTIRDESGAVLLASKDLREGQAEVVSVNLPNGTYVLFCSLAGHESLGIKGTLLIRP